MSNSNPPIDTTRQNNQDNHNIRRREIPKEDRIIHSINQLTSIEKGKVKNLYREAEIKGFRMDQIPQFIFLKSKINVSYSFVKALKHMQYEDDRSWFYELARDSTAYLSTYRLAIDKLSQLETEMWLIIMNPKIETHARVMATKEIHNIIKTGVLLMRDLPFITNLSKLYNIEDLEPEHKKTIRHLTQHKDPMDNNAYQQDKFQFLKQNTFNGINSSLVHNILEKTKDNKRFDEVMNSQDNDKPVDANVIEEMKKQMTLLGYNTDPAAQQAQEKLRKEAEERFIRHNLEKLDKELQTVGTEDEAKVLRIKQDYQKTLSYLNAFISEEQREAIDRIRDITDDDNTTG